MARILIVTPAPPGSRTGNRQTAGRWASMLRAAGHRVSVVNEWQGKRCDLLIALHADRSHASVRRYRDARPDGPLVVVLTGTDLYRDLPGSRQARESLALADHLIVLQTEAKRALAKKVRAKARVVFQSSGAKLQQSAPPHPFRIAVVGHLRKVKDPFRAVRAITRLEGDYEVVQVGAALDAKMAPIARAWQKREPRYRWLGSLAHAQALAWIARSHLLVVSSMMEGGANVICEAARIGTPVLASRVPGNVGMLGREYPGYYRLFDDRALARLVERCSGDASLYRGLKKKLSRRKTLFSPAAERTALARVVREALGRRPTSPPRGPSRRGARSSAR
jgi:putative glycosyltransferase (TIGR04348 family)